MNFFALSALVNVATSVVLGLLVISADRRAFLNRIFAAFAASVAFWSYAYFMWQISDNADTALFWVHMLMTGAIFITPVYFHFTVHFLQIQRRYLVLGGYVGALIFSLLNWTPLFIEGVAERAGFPFWPDAGILFAPYLLWWILYAALPIYYLLRSKSPSRADKTGVRILLTGTIIGYAGGCTNYFLWFGIGVLPFGNISASIYIACVAYVTMRNRLFSMKVIATELLIFALWLFIFVRLLLSESVQAQLIDGGLLFVSLVVGTLLIRSVDREVEQRQLIEAQGKELEAVNKQQESLLHFISHEIKGYLTKSEAAFSAIFSGDYGQVSPKLHEMSGLALADTRKGVDTVMGILDASNLKRGTVSYEKKPLDLAKVVGEVVRDLKQSAEERGLELDYTKDAGSYAMTGDEDKLHRHVVRNLIDNSIKYTRKGSIHVHLVRTAHSYVLTIKDTGVGITAEDMKRLFTEGGRGADSLKVNVHSTGYGLYIAKLIVEAHGGTIKAVSAGKDKGSEFIIEFPQNI